MGEMEKGLGPRRKPVKRRRKFARSLIEYLAADSYMYAPLIDGPPPNPSGRGLAHASLPAVSGKSHQPTVLRGSPVGSTVAEGHLPARADSTAQQD